MSIPETHLQPAGPLGRACETCGRVFTARRDWSRFCGTPCRNAYHAAEARIDKIKGAAVPMYEVLRQVRELVRGKDLEHVWVNYPGKPEETLGQRIDKVLAPLKPPVEPKALLEKAKA